MKTFLISIVEIVLAIIVSIFIIPIGIIYFIFKNIFKPLKIVIETYYLSIETFKILGYLLNKIAITLDLFWNVTAGEFLEDNFTKEENTTFGKGTYTVSASTGKLELNNTLNKKGKKLSALLNRVFNQKEHTIYAIKKHELIEEFNQSIEKLRK